MSGSSISLPYNPLLDPSLQQAQPAVGTLSQPVNALMPSVAGALRDYLTAAAQQGQPQTGQQQAPPPWSVAGQIARMPPTGPVAAGDPNDPYGIAAWALQQALAAQRGGGYGGGGPGGDAQGAGGMGY